MDMWICCINLQLIVWMWNNDRHNLLWNWCVTSQWSIHFCCNWKICQVISTMLTWYCATCKNKVCN